MPFPHLSNVIEQYKTTLSAVETQTPLSAKQALNLLLLRDEIQTWLSQPAQQRHSVLLDIAQLDKRLRKQAQPIAKTLDLDTLRASINPPETSWWWHFPKPIHIWNKLDWLWKFLTIVTLTASVSLVVDISSRFLSGGPDTLGAFAITTQSVLTLLASRSAFTRDGTAEVERFLANIKIPQHFHQEASFGLSILLLLGLLGFHASLPQIAVLYNNRGDRLFYDSNPPQLASALTRYQRALACIQTTWSLATV